jgi:hypothetical protein
VSVQVQVVYRGRREKKKVTQVAALGLPISCSAVGGRSPSGFGAVWRRQGAGGSLATCI